MTVPATIQEIRKVSPIPKADKIEQIQVLGWTSVSKKDEFKVGDLCAFIEIDSIVQRKPWNEFLFLEHSYKDKKERRIKTRTMRGCLSQGIAVPIRELTELKNRVITKKDIGLDVSKELGVVHYEVPEIIEDNEDNDQKNRNIIADTYFYILKRLGLIKPRVGNFPSYVHKTDELLMQSRPILYERLLGNDYYITVKLDGTSFTFSHREREFYTCSRKRFYNPDVKWRCVSPYVEISRKYDLKKKFKKNKLGNIAIQGEICGPKIQKNKLGLKENDIFVFDVWDIDNKQYFNWEQILNLCYSLELKTVPLIKLGSKFSLSQDELLTLAEGVYDGTTNQREGIVVRSLQTNHKNPEDTTGLEDPLNHWHHGRVSFKVMNNKYLLSEKD